MARRRTQPKSQPPQQPYDSALKGLMDTHAAEIIPEFVPDSQLIREENSEIERESIRADLVYRIQHKGMPHILNMELQTNADSEMPKRMLRYHVELHLDYDLPVISVVLYLFETSIPTSPFREMSGDEALLTLNYQVIALWTLDAQEYLQKGIISMYTFLPAMKGATAPLLVQAVREMQQHYSRYHFGRHLARFQRILQRSTMVSEEDKQKVEEELHMEYDSLIDENPEIQKRVAKGKAEGEIRGELRGLQEMVLEAVKDEYPPLVELAQEKVVRIRKPDSLRQLVKLIYKAPDENTARWLLNNFAA